VSPTSGKILGLALLGLAMLGYLRAIWSVEDRWGARWDRWRWWTSLPLWAGAALLAAILGGRGWAILVLMVGAIVWVFLRTQRSLRR
jgi:hypothetical protein